MKPTSRLFTTRKIVLGAVSLLSVAGIATAAPQGRSILHDARYDSVAFSMNASVLSPHASQLGALTLDDVYTFDFASAGIGTLIFRSHSNRLTTFTTIHDMPRTVPGLVSQPNSSNSDFFFNSSGHNPAGGFSLADESGVDLLGPIVATPEPGTWMGAMLALVAIGFTQRRRLRGLIGRHA